MWTTVALVTALGLAPAQAQAGELRLAHDRPTYGIMGAVRPDNKTIPGDFYCVTFDIENLSVDDGGRVVYSMGMEVTNSQGKVYFQTSPKELEAVNTLGGTSLPAFAIVEVQNDWPAGEYNLKITVTDQAAKKSQTLSRTIEVLPKSFGLIRLYMTYNTQGLPPAPSIGIAGQSYVVNFAAVGFERAGAKKEPNLTVEMQVIDAEGKPTLKKPFAGEIDKDLPPNIEVVPMQFLLALNRPGKFTVKLKATDLASTTKKTAELSVPITVLDSK